MKEYIKLDKSSISLHHLEKLIMNTKNDDLIFTIYKDYLKNNKLNLQLRNKTFLLLFKKFLLNKKKDSKLIEIEKEKKLRTVLADLQFFGLKMDLINLTYLLKFYFLIKDFAKVNQILHQMKKLDLNLDVKFYNTILKGFIQIQSKGHFYKTVQSIFQLLYKNKRNLTKNETEFSKFKINKYTLTLLVDGYMKFKDVESALCVFQILTGKFDIPITVNLNNFIHKFNLRVNDGENLRVNDGEIAQKNSSTSETNKSKFDISSLNFDLLEDDVTTHTAIINGLAKNRSVLSAQVWFNYMLREAVEPTTITITSLINFNAKQNHLAEADEYYEKMGLLYNLKPDIASLNALLGGYAVAGKYKEMMGLLKKFEKSLDQVTFAVLVKAFVKRGDFQATVDIYDWMISKNILPNQHIFNVILRRFCHIGVESDIYENQIYKPESPLIALSVNKFYTDYKKYVSVNDPKPSLEIYDMFISYYTSKFFKPDIKNISKGYQIFFDLIKDGLIPDKNVVLKLFYRSSRTLGWFTSVKKFFEILKNFKKLNTNNADLCVGVEKLFLTAFFSSFLQNFGESNKCYENENFSHLTENKDIVIEEKREVADDIPFEDSDDHKDAFEEWLKDLIEKNMTVVKENSAKRLDPELHQATSTSKKYTYITKNSEVFINKKFKTAYFYKTGEFHIFIPAQKLVYFHPVIKKFQIYNSKLNNEEFFFSILENKFKYLVQCNRFKRMFKKLSKEKIMEKYGKKENMFDEFLFILVRYCELEGRFQLKDKILDSEVVKKNFCFRDDIYLKWIEMRLDFIDEIK
ncbi:hypothetical protein HK099_006484 [Clydaea vesicula]|uniref:Pentatricopeptide repeat-containing protein n=1 Tax=Clydaea vesicula TaxID=447962 RepID=A0AAD5TYV4_9FUNG|nr:hypothetical protein HK099_006484 [Clydaea vesicula]